MATNEPPKKSKNKELKEVFSNFWCFKVAKTWLWSELSWRSFERLESTHSATAGNGIVGDLYNSAHSS